MSTAESGARVGAAKLLSRKIAAANSKWLSPTFKVLFVKTSSLGDVVHHLPAVSDAARKLPGAEIDWIVEEPFAGVAAMHGAVRRVIPVALRRWRARWWQRATWREIADFRRAVRAERYDAIVDTQSLVKSALVSTSALGTRHGMDAASAREPLAARFYHRRYAVARGLHAVERNRLLSAAALGYELDAPADYGLEVPPAEESEAPYTVFLTMTSRADKLWPEERWIELGRALARRIVLPWGNEAERMRATRIARGLPVADVPRRLSLEQLARLLARSQAVVGVDTGLTHLAAAVGTRTVGVYCGSDPALTGIYGAARATNVGARGRPPSADDVLRVLQ
ncbi:MAG: lipopolysaccharide heptosyltransferase I [Betaproteobacteria bacterium]|nr:MAG: lipopolysaccharide heptosyltransferase I [Betaproteobacteria bacterium]